MKNKKCLVTGGSGFVGTHLVKKLLDLGNDVRVLDIIEPNKSIVNNVEFCNVDIQDMDNVKKTCKDIDYVFHTVALVPISKADKIFDNVNAGGTKNIIEASMHHGVQSIMHLSSTSIYQIPKRGDIMDENYPIKPVGFYGKAKYHSEEICLEYIEKGAPISIIRPKTILGPNRLGIYSILFDWIMHGNPIFIFGDGDNKYSYVSISDLIESMILSAEKGIGQVFNIATDKYGTYRGDIEELINYANSKSKVHTVNATLCRTVLKFLDKLKLSPLSEWHYSIIDKEYVFDISKAKKILGWAPQDSNQKMFRDSYDWFKENYHLIDKIGVNHTSKLNPKIFKIINKL